MKIAIGIPNTGSIKSRTVLSLLSILWNTPDATFHFINHQGCYVHENREKIVFEAKKAEADYLLFIDADMDFDQFALQKLLDLNKDVVGANYNQRQLPLISTVKFLGDDGKYKNVDGKDFPTVPFKCGAVATGFMLIKMSVFDKIEKPWFFFDEVDGDLIGEDVFFCRQCIKAGIEIWCDPTISIAHIGDFLY